VTTSLKAELAAGTVVPGVFVMEFASNGIGRIAAAAGAKFVVFDMEHTGWTAETIARLVATTRLAEVTPVVRVPANQPWFLAQALDAGAVGVMAPAVGSAEQARAAVAACKYPPAGRRGATFGYAHDDYRLGDAAETMRLANQATAVIVQIETAEGVRNADEVAAVDGVDVLWVGHNDLTASLGIPGQLTHPDYLAALERVTAACQQHGKAAGISAAAAEAATAMFDRGFRCIAYGDIRLFLQALGVGIQALREHAAQAGGE
jgi:2-keto-3-deoxy-L-rhamnonate aldolase RhmA